jgi:hypothetical protein
VVCEGGNQNLSIETKDASQLPNFLMSSRLSLCFNNVVFSKNKNHKSINDFVEVNMNFLCMF